LTSNLELDSLSSFLSLLPPSYFARHGSQEESDRRRGEFDTSPYHPNFPLYPEAELVVESLNKILFATRAVYLRASSSLFDDILSLPPQEDREKKDGHPLIKIDEEGALFEIFLRYAHRGRLLVDGQPPLPPWSAVLLLSKLFDKYDSPDLARFFLIEHLPKFIRDPIIPLEVRGPSVVAGTKISLPPPVEVFAISSIHGLEDLAQRSLRWNHNYGTVSPGTLSLSHNDSADPRKMHNDWRPHGLGDLKLDLLSRVPLKVVLDFSKLIVKVLTTPGYSWINAGDDFKVRRVSLHLSLSFPHPPLQTKPDASSFSSPTAINT